MTTNQILKLNASEKILLSEAVWDNLERERKQLETYSLSVEQKRILEAELFHFEEDPTEGSCWDEIKERILERK